MKLLSEEWNENRNKNALVRILPNLTNDFAIGQFHTQTEVFVGAAEALKGYPGWKRNTSNLQIVEGNVRRWEFVAHDVHSGRDGSLGVQYEARVAKTVPDYLLHNHLPQVSKQANGRPKVKSVAFATVGAQATQHHAT